MSGSETGLMSSREPLPFTMDLQNNSMHTQPGMQTMRFGGSSMYNPINPASPSYQHKPSGSAAAGDESAGGRPALNPVHHMSMGGSEQMKKKRGRPRKYGTNGPAGLGLTSGGAPAFNPNQTRGGDGGLSSSPAPSPGGPASPIFKKSKGRPPGSIPKKQRNANNLLDLGSTGLGFTPHVITVKAGEDVSLKIMAFTQHGPRAVCVLSANGSLSSVTLRQPATSSGSVTYEGRFEILSLSGSFTVTGTGNQQGRTGGLSVSLSGPDGRVIGGGVAGLLIAASPVQVVVGTFVTEGRKERKFKKSKKESSVSPPAEEQTGPSSPQSPGATHSESSGEFGSPSPHNQQSTGAYHNADMSGIQWE